MNLIIACLFSAALSFGAGWQVQAWRHEALLATHIQQEADRAQQSQQAQQLRLEQALQAQNEATARVARLQSAATAARDELGRLRRASSGALLASQASPQACATATTAFDDVFQQCAEQLTAVSAAADQHASDVQTLSDAWPTE